MLEPFKSGKLLLARAGEHLNQFDLVEKGFLTTKPYRFFSDIDPNTGEERHKFSVASDIGDELPVIAFDIVNCLRSALDHVVFDSARELRGDPSPRDTKFPFGKSPDDAARDINRYKANEVPLSIRPFLLSFEPYKGGKEAIWELNELRNQKIHRVLQAVATYSSGIDFGNGFIQHARLTTVSEWDHAKGELTYLRLQPGAKMQIQVAPLVRVGFSDIDLFGTKAAAEVFRDFLKVIEGIVLGVETETRRLKL